MPDRLFADVALPLPPDAPFTYEVPPALRARAVPGMRAVVPFRNRSETGYVVGLSSTTALERVRAIVDFPDANPVFSSEMIELCRWIADYYCCSLGETLQSAVPAGLRTHTTLRYSLVSEKLANERCSDRQEKIVAELHRRGPLTSGQIASSVGASSLGNTLRALVARGILAAETVVSDPGVSMRTETWVRLVEERIPPPETLAALQRNAPKQAAVYLDLLHGDLERPAVELYAKHDATSTVLAGLEKKGFVERLEREILRTPEFAAEERSRAKLTLNPDQQAAYDAITETMNRGDFQTFLLWGVTGSGKTEVYLQVIERALELGKSAILLVPEISLTPQTVGRLLARFQTRIAVLHSGLGRGERYDEWRRAQRGEVRIVVGARSAVFAPLPDLGAIVVDEEHDGSYKQDDAPRYHGRDVAIVRAKLARAVCVLGSATPSIESYYNTQIGKSTRLELRRRATSAPLPEVRLVDMRVESKETAGQIILSRTLDEAVNDRVARKEQVVLLLNRRGFAPFVLCPKCGWIAECGNCCVSLTYHASSACLLCHYCNTKRDVPQVCDECHFNPLLFLGIGTQKLEDFLLRSFRGARLARMDADTTAGKGGHAKILGRFARGEIDVLVGTQMIAKGHDYPGVTLVGVVNADTGLSVPDFRAAENTFQLLTQVAGRAGRGDRPGQVIIQTYRPNHYAVQAAAQHDYEAFYAREIAQRRAAGYPPFRRMINLAIESEDPLVADKATARLHRILRDTIAALEFPAMEILGPAPAAVRRVKRKYRWNLALLSKSAPRLNRVARDTRDAYRKTPEAAKALLKMDADPYGVF